MSIPIARKLFWSNLATIAKQLCSQTSFFVHRAGSTFNPPAAAAYGYSVNIGSIESVLFDLGQFVDGFQSRSTGWRSVCGLDCDRSKSGWFMSPRVLLC